jgi:predicted ATP-dependent protease
VRKAHSKRKKLQVGSKEASELQKSRRKRRRSIVLLSTPRSGAAALFHSCTLSLAFTPWSTDLTVKRLGNKQSVMRRTQEELDDESKSDEVESEDKECAYARNNSNDERRQNRKQRL